jgi:hypothetical protein
MKMLLNRKLSGSLFALFLATLIVGCGGGGAGGGSGGSSGGSGGTTNTPTLTLIITGQPVTVSQPATVQITGPSNTLVTLSTTVGTLSKNQVATDSNGAANVQLSISLSDNNDGTVTASVTSGGTTLTKTAAFMVGATNLSLGKAGAPFTDGQLAIGIGASSLSPGGTTQITALVWDNAANAAYGQPINVSFSSPCISSGAATISSPVQTVNGTASTTYKNVSCQGSDQVTASIAVGGGAKTANGSITFANLTANNISFVAANPAYINLAGVGVGVTALSFRVKDSTGVPVPNQQVDFVLNTTVGGLSLTSASNQTDANGLVTTSINPGSIPTSVRVTATVHGSTISTQSSQLAVTTGLPAQGHMSISVSTHAVEALEYDGIGVDVTARLADRYGNPVPDGTTVNFVTEGGVISDPSNVPAGFCKTTDGACSMKWRSQAPRPNDHRIVLLAYAIGEKDFYDADGDGYFSLGDSILLEQGEAYMDADESNAWNVGEFYHDFNLNASYNVADGKYYGARCKTNCGGNSMDVSSSNIILLSSSTPILSSDKTSLSGGGTVLFQLWDKYGQPMPAGTKVDCSTSGTYSTAGPASYTVPDTIGVRTGGSVSVITAATAAGSIVYGPNAYNFACGVVTSLPITPGKLFVKVTTPGKLETIFSLVDLN